MTNIIQVDFGRGWFNRLDYVVQRHLEEGVFPGVEILFYAQGEIHLHEAWGRREVGDGAPRLETNTLFDVASLTKPVITATAALLLQERGLLDLEEPARAFLPEFDGDGREAVTLRQLLCHTSGLPWWENLYEGAKDRAESWRRLMAVPLARKPDTQVEYSCLGYLLMGEVIRRVSGQSLSDFAETSILRPLGMNSSGFSPWKRGDVGRVAPTEFCPWRKKLLRGVVHDENCYAFGEEGGNSGLFSTASDLLRYCEFLFNEGELDGERLLSPLSVSRLTHNANRDGMDPRTPGFDYKGVHGWYSCGDLMPPGAIGHTGFTGVSLWLDIPMRAAVIVLSNRVHLSREKNLEGMRRFRPRVHNILLSALEALFEEGDEDYY